MKSILFNNLQEIPPFKENEDKNFNNLDGEQKFIFSLLSENLKILNAVGKFMIFLMNM